MGLRDQAVVHGAEIRAHALLSGRDVGEPRAIGGEAHNVQARRAVSPAVALQARLQPVSFHNRRSGGSVTTTMESAAQGVSNPNALPTNTDLT